jgi:hypothetical protein
MPLHDWSKVRSGVFHHFHQAWTVELCRSLNGGLLPAGHSALIEQKLGSRSPDLLTVEERIDDMNPSHGGVAVLERPRVKTIIRQSDAQFYSAKANRIAIHQPLGRVVAILEIVSPGNKDSRRALGQLVGKIADTITAGVHVLVIDPHPPGPFDPDGIHAAIWELLDPTESPLMDSTHDRLAVAYESTSPCSAYLEPIGVGDRLPTVPLFIAEGAHVPVPLEKAYAAAWDLTPPIVRRAMGLE